MPRSEAQKRADRKYNAKRYYQIGIRFERSDIDDLKSAIESSGESFNAFVVGAVYDKLRRLQIPVGQAKKEEQ